jgi:hypothetical protein
MLTSIAWGNTGKAFGVNRERLIELKKRYDPHNVFKKWANLFDETEEKQEAAKGGAYPA